MTGSILCHGWLHTVCALKILLNMHCFNRFILCQRPRSKETSMFSHINIQTLPLPPPPPPSHWATANQASTCLVVNTQQQTMSTYASVYKAFPNISANISSVCALMCACQNSNYSQFEFFNFKLDNGSSGMGFVPWPCGVNWKGKNNTGLGSGSIKSLGDGFYGDDTSLCLLAPHAHPVSVVWDFHAPS